MMGDNNHVHGRRNVVLGERNKLRGRKNWVFTADYKGRVNHTLVIDKWKIDLDHVENIKQHPSLAISKWHPHY